MAGTLALFQDYQAVRAKGRHLEPAPGDHLPLKGLDVVVVSARGATIAQPLAGVVGSVDVYLVAHHGGADAADPATLAAFRPRVAILDNGARKGAGTAHWIKVSASVDGSFRVTNGRTRQNVSYAAR